MQNINYLCIDDQQDRTIDDLLQLLRSQQCGLTIERKTPIDLDAQIKQIKISSENQSKFGLLLDLRLDQESSIDMPKVGYRGPTLAQELRTRMTEKKIKPFPIILWSITEKFVKSFDDTSHDLFDAVYGKDDQIINQSADVARQMASLVDGYEKIGLNRTPSKINLLLGLDDQTNDSLDDTFIDEFKFYVGKKAVHEIASYLLNMLVIPNGLLVDEQVLAARLGIDTQASGQHWNSLLNTIEAAKYAGPFCLGWNRWWWTSVEKWWSDLSEKQPNIRRIGAAGRAGILNEKLGLKLIAATPIQSNYSDKFFVLCVATKRPIDPSDGLRIAELNVKPWHDTQYVSNYAALKRIAKERWRISLLDRDRFDRLQQVKS